MQLKRAFCMSAAFLLTALVPAHAVHVRRGPTSHQTQKSHKSKAASKAFKGQRAIDSGRATEIQSALIKAGYLKGEPTGQWDAQTTSALQKLQGDNGWQTKITPDSRALIKLGLGPQNISSVSSEPATVNDSSASFASVDSSLSH